jgi:hypothetical protein
MTIMLVLHVLGNVRCDRKICALPKTGRKCYVMFNAHKGDNTVQSLWWIHDKSGDLFEPKIHYMKTKKI